LVRAGSAEDIFSEAPRGWYFDTEATGQPNEFKIVEIERPREGKRPPLILTVKNEQKSYEFSVDLDAASGSERDARAAPSLSLDPRK
jgi:hypothetical protein